MLSLAALPGCSPALCYSKQDRPRFAGRYAPAAANAAAMRLRVVSFNVAFAKEVEAATRLFLMHPLLREADVILLQEMDERGTDAMARELRLDYVYYPAIRHPKYGNNFGNAVLSRWPIVADRKLVLPGHAHLDGAIRTATLAELAIGRQRVTVVSTHLSTPFELGFGSRRMQLMSLLGAVLARRAIVGGDFNDPDLPVLLSRRGFAWPTRDIGGTARFGRSLDHILLRGLARVQDAAGKVVGFPGISDHVPVYADVGLASLQH